MKRNHHENQSAFPDVVRAGLIVMAVLCLGMLADATSAVAANVSYVGNDGNVYRTSPNGALNEKLTTDGGGEYRYTTPSQKNDGTVAAIKKSSGSSAFVHMIRPSDRTIVDSWILPKTGAGSFVPFNGGTISPDGGVFIYDWHYFDCGTNPCGLNQRVSIIAGPGTTNPCLINCHTGFIRPRWIPGTPYAGFVDTAFNRIWVQKAGSAQPVGWLGFNDPNGGDMESFDVSTNGRTVLEVTPENSNRSEFAFWNNNGTPPSVNSTYRCSAVNVAAAPAYPRFSPDGSMITWQDNGGVWVAPVPAQDGGGNCALNATRIAEGKEPSWGQATLVPTGPTGPTGPTSPTGPTGPTSPTGPTGPTSPTGPTGPTSPTGPTGPTSPTGPTGPTGSPAIASLRATPGVLKVKAGRTGKLTVAVTASGGTVQGLKVCATVPRKSRAGVKLSPCATVPSLDPGTARKLVFKARTTRRAKGTHTVTVKASASGLAGRGTTARIKITR
ncbi:MAG TPA: hypothetical protein VMF31_09805 [Solirubrobacterales bacterium]|nr:hypothetical protein [Solirubrobacterales bacterium]